MCNLYRMTSSVEEIARLFGVRPDSGGNFAAELYPGYPGLVVADGRARVMNWGFPLVLQGARGGALKLKPVTNAREDKLLAPFWRNSFQRRRCLVPVTAWAEPEGPKGRKIRTWYSLGSGETFAVAGLWRPTRQWGDCYALVMVNGHAQMAEAHDRMPLILPRARWDSWLHGATSQALDLCVTWPGSLSVERSGEPWSGSDRSMRQPDLI
ncbi:MAG: SOS response-associated peptidase [Novosphingobium sp.]|nr:SOS response-associated peptidase [Novosphingobium sp.]